MTTDVMHWRYCADGVMRNDPRGTYMLVEQHEQIVKELQAGSIKQDRPTQPVRDCIEQLRREHGLPSIEELRREHRLGGTV
jgi:hypothetical protein